MPTRLAVLADVHGNLPALQAVLADFEQYEVNAILVAGDLIAGPQPDEVIQLLRSLDAWLILGNNEIGLLDYLSRRAPQAWSTHEQFALGRWIFGNVPLSTVEFLQTLPIQAVYQADGLPSIHVVHGSPRDPNERLFPDRQPEILDIALSQSVEPVLVCGHTHQPWCLRRNGRLALNPGAVGCSLNGDPRACYAILVWQDDDWAITHRMVDYNIDATAAAFHTSGLLQHGGALARTFLLSMQTGRDVSMEFLNYAYHLAQKMGFPESNYVPDSAWFEASRTFNWKDYSG